MLAAYYPALRGAVIPVTKGTQEIEIYTHTLPMVTISFRWLLRSRVCTGFVPVKSRAEEWVSAAIAVLLDGGVSGVSSGSVPPTRRELLPRDLGCSPFVISLLSWPAASGSSVLDGGSGPGGIWIAF